MRDFPDADLLDTADGYRVRDYMMLRATVRECQNGLRYLLLRAMENVWTVMTSEERHEVAWRIRVGEP